MNVFSSLPVILPKTLQNSLGIIFLSRLLLSLSDCLRDCCLSNSTGTRVATATETRSLPGSRGRSGTWQVLTFLSVEWDDPAHKTHQLVLDETYGHRKAEHYLYRQKLEVTMAINKFHGMPYNSTSLASCRHFSRTICRPAWRGEENSF